MSLITTQRELLEVLKDTNLQLSVSEGKARVIRRDDNTIVAHVKRGLPTKMLDKGLMVYNGWYELNEAKQT